jgi:glycosyltransferase involved in cell wall biosynthesis
MAPTRSGQQDNRHRDIPINFTVVIPTWNEEGWLPALLRRLRTMKRVAQVVVADNWSNDNTRDIALAEGVQVASGGTPARGRNNGARASTGDYIIFADADVVFTSKTLDRTAELFGDSNIVAVHFPLKPLGATWFPRFCYKAMDVYFWLLSRLRVAQGVGTFLAVRRSAFDQTGGFDESLTVGEDAEFLRRLSRLGIVYYDRTIVVGTSPRRFLTENSFLFALKVCVWALLRLIGLHTSWMRYHWKRYPFSLSELDSITFEQFFKNFDKTPSDVTTDSGGHAHGC